MAISVIVTCFNLERYIGAAIDSVLAQDFGGEVEIIVVDDCSTDGSADEIRKRPSVRYLGTQSNGGVLLAMIAGLRAASHDRIALLDGDDLWMPGKLAALDRAFDSDPAIALVTHDLLFIDGEGRAIDRNSRPEEVLAAIPPADRGEKTREGILAQTDYVWLGSALAVRRSIGDVDGFIDFANGLPDPRNCYQDWPLAYWVAATPGARLAYIPDKLFRYRLHGANHSGDSRTAERALRNHVRTRNTADAMLAIAGLKGVSATYQKTTRRKLQFSEYLVDLYAGRRLRALTGFARLIGAAGEQSSVAKEILRFAGVELLGPERFARIKDRRG